MRDTRARPRRFHLGDREGCREGRFEISPLRQRRKTRGRKRAGEREASGMRQLGGMLLLILLILLLSPSVAQSDASPPAPKCTAPLKQTEFATRFQVDRYKATVDLYRSCLEDFVKEQERAIENHRQAVQSAIDDWNKFVGKEAKEPPRTPQDKGGGQGRE